ncbi:MAG: bifunctional 4-hydroxy-2-oxoglutarate aldolase/2-dehydro-3-deoxy-phosphogluconate aldolase [Pseudomonadales bacterium]|nr:bifunctional 4-hydroxy-2-oxoglutarate aldolase/2-dehydro-3-deoxy-phosphogluconate aldolase [Pseudomonadales bacterium]
MQTFPQLLNNHKPIIAVITIEDPSHALPIAKALAEGGVSILEITLRSQHGLDAIKRIREEMPALCVGAGTVTKPSQFSLIQKAGAQFSVSPGLTPSLIEAARDHQSPFLPGAITPSEILMGIEGGLEFLKFFPAESSGGVDFLKNLAGPFPNIKFCPTGGVIDTNIQQYLSTGNVFCVGTTWLTPPELIKEQRWGDISSRAQLLTKQY